MEDTAHHDAHRGQVAQVFRERLTQAMERANIRASALASRIGVDRSTLSQLLSSKNDRLPRADTVAAMAAELQVSLDWLLGLSNEARRGADIIHESMQVSPSAQHPVDTQIERWHEEARGYKIRHVPASLPDLVKTDEVLRYEYSDFAARDAEDAISAGTSELERTRLPEAEMEVCMQLQDLHVFAAGGGFWSGLEAAARRRQLEQFVELYDELYPSLRIYLYDGLTHYSVPYTIFGPIRAALYVGQLYFVFNTRDHVRVLTRHFDELIKGSVVQAHDMPATLRGLIDDVA